MKNIFDRFVAMALIAFALVPLAIWKLVDIIIWIITHISIRWH